WGRGRRRCVPLWRALGVVLPALVVPLVASVGGVLQIGVQQPAFAEMIGVPIRRRARELVAGLADFGESEGTQTVSMVLDVTRLVRVVWINVRRSASRGVV